MFPAQAAPAVHRHAASADARLKALYDAYAAWDADQTGQFWNESGELQPADHLPRVDEASQLRREAHLKDVLGRLDAIPVKRLSAAEQVNAQVFRTVLDNALIEARFRTWEMPFNSDSSFWTYLDADSLDSAPDARRYIARMRDIPRYFDEQIVNMRAGLARGFTVPQVTLAGRDASIATFADRDVTRNPFYAAFKHMPSTMPVAEQFALRDQGVAAIKQQVVPAYEKLLRFYREEYLPKARTSVSAHDLPDGDAFYRAQIREYTTTGMTPEADPPARPQRSRADRRRDGQDHGRSGLQGIARRFPQIPEDRPAILRQDARRADGGLGLCAEAGGWEDRHDHRDAAAPALRPHAGRGFDRALLHFGAGRRRAQPRLHDEHLQSADAAALQHPGADASRMRARPQPADRHPVGAEGAAADFANTSISRAPARAGACTASGSVTS